MRDIKRFVANWLTDDACYDKALLKYEIKQLDSRLQRVMGDGKNARLKTREAAQFCSEMALKYERLLQILNPDFIEEADVILPDNIPSRCYVTIQTLKQQLILTTSLAGEIEIVSQLKQHYQYLQILLNGMQPQFVELNQRALTGRLRAIIGTYSTSEWLLTVVAFANESAENLMTSMAVLAQLNNKELLQLAALFEQEEMVSLINSIFFYKLNPHQLFEQVLHPEKLISVRTRLSLLHHFIEMIHQTVLQALKQRGISKANDYLFHGDELPQGIAINPSGETKDMIILALKAWRPVTLSTGGLLYKSKVYELFRAYKFWFNPDCLIDTVMTLQLQLAMDAEAIQEHSDFPQQMQHLFQQLSTTECLDLYGYFSNKDSRYLMRTLAAVLEGQEIPSLPIPAKEHMEAIEEVYKALNVVMEAVRDELTKRHIITAPYARDSHKPVAPGRRNINAVSRIMSLYQRSAINENKRIGQLFDEVEANS
ncbi:MULTISPECIES: hypothetical protein [unclassified Legionella]|uniref:hypothetical protein n=1 Tax=unclassified Legionella TaxID=2622702 RepID=UPI0010546201|nr:MULTISPECIES: hypothetical protein [unclassified Legionella]MDI9818767.1 hypothetical protein [Legionella sp. PL877]